MTEEQINNYNRQFNLSKSQIEKFIEWQETLPDAYFGCDSNGIKIIFYQNSLGIIVKAKRREGEEVDLTEWEHF